MDITDTLNPILIYSTLTASCALKKNLTFSTTKWIISLLALPLCIHQAVIILNGSEFARTARKHGESAAGGANVLPDSKMQIITQSCMRLITICAGIVNQLHVLLLTHRSFVCVAEKLFYVDVALKTSSEQHKKDRRIVWFYLSCSLIFLTMQIYYGYILGRKMKGIPDLYIYYVYIYQGNTSTELQYIALCQIIRSRFKLINTNLNNLKRQLKNRQQNLMYEFELYRRTHLTLTKLAQRTNSIYNIRLFFSFTCCMTNVVTNLYFIFFGKGHIFKSGDGFKFLAIKSIWVLHYTVRMIMICRASELLCKEANASRGIVSKMARYACNVGLKHEVMLFIGSLSLTQINLKVARLAKMETKLVVQVIASATSILLTLVQMQKN